MTPGGHRVASLNATCDSGEAAETRGAADNSAYEQCKTFAQLWQCQCWRRTTWKLVANYLLKFVCRRRTCAQLWACLLLAFGVAWLPRPRSWAGLSYAEALMQVGHLASNLLSHNQQVQLAALGRNNEAYDRANKLPGSQQTNKQTHKRANKHNWKCNCNCNCNGCECNSKRGNVLKKVAFVRGLQ